MKKILFTSILENCSHVKSSESLVNFLSARKFTILEFDNQNYLHLRNMNLMCRWAINKIFNYKIRILSIRIVTFCSKFVLHECKLNVLLRIVPLTILFFFPKIN